MKGKLNKDISFVPDRGGPIKIVKEGAEFILLHKYGKEALIALVNMEGVHSVSMDDIALDIEDDCEKAN